MRQLRRSQVQRPSPNNFYAGMPTPGVSRVTDFEELIQGKIPDFLVDYYASGAGDEQTLEESKKAFQRIYLKPRILRSIANIDISSKLQGHSVSFPFGIAPTGLQAIAHPDGPKATARAAEKAGVIMILTSWSLMTLEEVAASAPKAHLWMQVYPFKDRRNTADMVKRAERSGYKAIVVTIDSPRYGPLKRRFRDRLGAAEYIEKYDIKGVVNLQGAKDDIARAKADGDTQLFHYMNIQAAWDQSWDDIAWIRSITDLPIILKGIITDENAKEAVAAGVQGIIVSAHGGRQLDGIQAPIEALPEVVDAVRGSGVEVYMDGGVRSGRDIFKALALGAKAVFIGRPAVWGLIHNGTDGIVEIMDMMKEEFINTMSLCGCNSLHELNRSFVKRNNHLACKL